MTSTPFALSQRVQRVKLSANAAASARASALIAQGRDVLVLTAGEPDFDTPQPIKQAAIAALARGETKYTPTAGTTELRRAISAKYRRENALDYPPAQIVVSNGAKQVIFNALAATLDAGDEVVLPAPYWPSFPDIVAVNDGTPVIVPVDESTAFKLTPPVLEAAITPRTRWLILNSPGNPSGAVYTATELAALAEVLRRHPRVLVLWDEIYEHIWFTAEAPVHLLQVAPDLRERTLLVNGASKTYAMTGWRIGWGAGPKALVDAMVVIQSQASSGPNSIGQAAVASALVSADQSFVTESRRPMPGARSL
jgi:aspartate aminotransferase